MPVSRQYWPFAFILIKLIIVWRTLALECSMLVGSVLDDRRLPDQQGVVLTARNRTGPPCSVDHSTAQAPGGRPARPPAALQTTTDDDDI